MEYSFLQFVALHSGLFLRRHFLQFSGLKSGELITNLLKRLQKNRHSRILKLSKNVSVYHLNSRTIHQASGYENPRHRHPHRVDYVKTKLFAIDYVLENRNFHYLPAEEEKVSFFTKNLQIPLADLPVKTYKTPNSKTETHRYFVYKFPLYVTSLSSELPVVHFSYVDPRPLGSVIDYVNHLRSYPGLLNRLQEFRFIFIYHASARWKNAESIFQTLRQSGFNLNREDLELSKLFHLRRAWECQEYEKSGSLK